MEQRKTKATVASIETEYVRSLRKKEDWRKKQKRRLRQKLAIYAVIFALVLGGMTKMYIGQQKTLAKKEQEKVEMLSKLEDVQEETEALKQQLVLLDDDEYIAKLARKHYFLSEENEIIFSVPEKNKKKDKKEAGKE